MAKKKSIVNTDISIEYKSSYESICHTVGVHSYGPAFSKRLIEELSKYHSQKEVSSLLKCFTQGAAIINKETFLSNYKIGVGDIGHEAWKACNGELLDFVPRVISLMEIHKQRGESQIDLSSVLFYLASFTRDNNNEAMAWWVVMALRSIAAATVGARFNPYFIQIVHPQLCDPIQEKLGLDNTSMYRTIVGTLIEEYDKIYERDLCVSRNPSMSFPRMKFAIPVEYSPKKSQIRALSVIFAITIEEATRLFKDIASLSEPSVELFTLFDTLKTRKSMFEIDNHAVLSRMKKLEAGGKFITYPRIKDYHRYFCYSNNSTLSLKAIKKYKVESAFVDKESFIKEPFNDAATIEINCKKFLNMSQLHPFIDAAAKVLMSKVRKVGIQNFPSFYGLENPKLLIQLTDVTLYNTDFVRSIKEIEAQMKDTYMQNFQIQIQYDETTARSKFGEGNPKYLRVISDIHADVNKDRHYVFDFGDDFVINCGDTATNVHEERSWIRTFMQDGVVVAGNHLGYTSDKPELNGDTLENHKFESEINTANTYNVQLEKLIDAFPHTGSVRYLSNGIIEVDGMIFIGNTLYTDFKLFGEENQAACMMEAARKMNDFKLRYSLQRDEYGNFCVRPFTVEQHLKMFRVCKGYISNRLRYLQRHYVRKPVIIVTHHCPLPFCISEEYKNSPLSAAFASDMTKLLEEFPTIRLWCSGHVHAPYDFIYNQTRFVAEPWGYFNENGFDINLYGNRISVKDVKSVRKSWRTLLKEELKAGVVKDYGFSSNFEGAGSFAIKKFKST